MDTKMVKEGCYAFALALYFFPIERHPIFHTAQHIFDAMKPYLNTSRKKKVNVDHLKRGISKLNAVKYLAERGYIEIGDFECSMGETLNEEVTKRGKQIKILRSIPVHQLLGYNASSKLCNDDIDEAINTLTTRLVIHCTTKEKDKEPASGVKQIRTEGGRFGVTPAAFTPAPRESRSAAKTKQADKQSVTHAAGASDSVVAVSPDDSVFIRKQNDSETSVIYTHMLDEEAHNFRAWEMEQIKQQEETSEEEESSITRASLLEEHLPMTWKAKIASITSHSYARKNKRAEITLAKAEADLRDATKNYDAVLLEFKKKRKEVQEASKKEKKKEKVSRARVKMSHPRKGNSQRLAHQGLHNLQTKRDRLEKSVQHYALQLELAKEYHAYRQMQIRKKRSIAARLVESDLAAREDGGSYLLPSLLRTGLTCYLGGLSASAHNDLSKQRIACSRETCRQEVLAYGPHYFDQVNEWLQSQAKDPKKLLIGHIDNLNPLVVNQHVKGPDDPFVVSMPSQQKLYQSVERTGDSAKRGNLGYPTKARVETTQERLEELLKHDYSLQGTQFASIIDKDHKQQHIRSVVIDEGDPSRSASHFHAERIMKNEKARTGGRHVVIADTEYALIHEKIGYIDASLNEDSMLPIAPWHLQMHLIQQATNQPWIQVLLFVSLWGDCYGWQQDKAKNVFRETAYKMARVLDNILKGKEATATDAPLLKHVWTKTRRINPEKKQREAEQELQSLVDQEEEDEEEEEEEADADFEALQQQKSYKEKAVLIDGEVVYGPAKDANPKRDMKETFSDDDLTHVCVLLIQLARVGGFRVFYDIILSMKQYARTKEKIYILYEASLEVMSALEDIIEKEMTKIERELGRKIEEKKRGLYCEPARLLLDWLKHTLPLLVKPFQDKSLTGSAVLFHENIGNFVKMLGSFPCDKVTRAVMYQAMQHVNWQKIAPECLSDFLAHHTKMNDLIIEMHNSVVSRHRSIHGTTLTSEKLCKVGPSIMMNRLVKTGQWFDPIEWKPGDKVRAPNGASEEDDTEHGEIYDIEAYPKLEANKPQIKMVGEHLKKLLTRLVKIGKPVNDPPYAADVPKEKHQYFENDLHSKQRRRFGALRIRKHIIPATMNYLEKHSDKHDRQQAERDVPAFQRHLNSKYTRDFLHALLLHVGEHVESKAVKEDLVKQCLDVFRSPTNFQEAKDEMKLTRDNAKGLLVEEKSKRAEQRSAQAKRTRVRFAREDDDGDERACESDDEEMEVDVVAARSDTPTRGGRAPAKRKHIDDDATEEELRQSIAEDKQSRKKRKLNQSIRERQKRIQQSSHGEKSLCTDCAETFEDKLFCNCHQI